MEVGDVESSSTAAARRLRGARTGRNARDGCGCRKEEWRWWGECKREVVAVEDVEGEGEDGISDMEASTGSTLKEGAEMGIGMEMGAEDGAEDGAAWTDMG